MSEPVRIVEGRYRLVREVGRGGFGRIYAAEHVWTSRRVAVKTLAFEVTWARW